MSLNERTCSYIGINNIKQELVETAVGLGEAEVLSKEFGMNPLSSAKFPSPIFTKISRRALSATY